ncbi:hypothetical protein VNI00_011845 [Paramarasmius palmivorus]|uniref:Uncharacterized protein n=1 Tax=Paramarasmius palmivorus TaxID=297713 RepID=A0AAW0C6R9_9AGAR
MRLSVIGDSTARRLVDQHNFQGYARLQRMLLSYWDVDSDTMEDIIDHLRAPPDIISVGLERDRGCKLPCSEPFLLSVLPIRWLTAVMSPEGMDIVFSRWEEYVQQDPSGRLVSLEEALDNAFTINTEPGDAIWSEMDIQLRRKNNYIHSARLYHT